MCRMDSRSDFSLVFLFPLFQIVIVRDPTRRNFCRSFRRCQKEASRRQAPSKVVKMQMHISPGKIASCRTTAPKLAQKPMNPPASLCRLKSYVPPSLSPAPQFIKMYVIQARMLYRMLYRREIYKIIFSIKHLETVRVNMYQYIPQLCKVCAAARELPKRIRLVNRV